LKAELQVRTLAQHMWAAASHKLQYKQELSVPPPVRRAIHRVSALLETVDLEFERVLESRATYSSTLDLSRSDQTLNVDSVEALLSEMLPAKNKSANETYGELLEDLLILKVDTVSKLRSLLEKHMDAVAKTDAKHVERRRREEDYKGTTRERVEKGVFFRHVGWVRNALRKEFGGSKIDEVLQQRRDVIRQKLATQKQTSQKASPSQAKARPK
jgi:hypothetical protein